MTDKSMTSVGVLPRRIDVRSPASRARLRARYRRDSRFRWYGVAALAIATAFLAVLITDIFTKGWPAFWQHSLRLDVPLSAGTLDPEGKQDRATLLGADYMALAKSALATAVPGIEGRTAKKQLNEILSTGAVDDLRNKVVADPALIGQTLSTRLLLSDTADLYLKGEGTRISQTAATRGIATPGGTSGEITVSDERQRLFRGAPSGKKRSPIQGNGARCGSRPAGAA